MDKMMTGGLPCLIAIMFLLWLLALVTEQEATRMRWPWDSKFFRQSTHLISAVILIMLTVYIHYHITHV